MDFESVLEVGCGFGRIARLIRSVRPDAEYTGIDISPTMIASADVPGVIVSSLADYRPRRKYDLVIAVEVLMHVPPRDVQAAVRKLDRLASRYIVTCDWTVPVANVADHNFLHDYSGIGGRAIPVGMQSIRVIEK
jgi:trans-aconitate methyltransferase